ncbi:MBL fold metallo-hydrolase [Amphritea balenae]|uniref:MBL fold metallo-hydrolase n=1 Tax=Amphritea balenae TaxID=452629 RepID=A0A3P1SV79_9GAMM|nr:MBL fold metallo-hydrolase [Amphritea balenae]RRD01059.1 MBL fold metallo-hydrolase [Amphritea balenae]GGK60271.1 MBL fold metallo-hydrolase [Amphritea balenae]
MTLSLKQLSATAILTACSVLSTVQAADLTLKVFNPGDKSLFPVTSTLITGPTEAVLIDAQFQRDDAQSVLKMIQESGKELKTIYISHGDPDFYFGLDVISDAYPNASIVSSPETLKHIRATIDRKIGYWGPILGKNAPQKTIIPSLLKSNTLTVDGEELNIIGLNGQDPKHTFVWIPSIKTVTGGVIVYEKMHVWMADNQTAESRDKWLHSLDRMLSLEPEKIVPGHYSGTSSMNTEAIEFTQQYIRTFEDSAIAAKSSMELAEEMNKKFPEFAKNATLELSAKVIKGEMQWP